jgi:hypothetical protein
MGFSPLVVSNGRSVRHERWSSVGAALEKVEHTNEETRRARSASTVY